MIILGIYFHLFYLYCLIRFIHLLKMIISFHFLAMIDLFLI